MAIKVPRKYTKKAKSVTVIDGTAPDAIEVAPKAPKVKPCCTALTSKKEACKFSALKGEVFCKRHLKQSAGDSEPKEPKAKKAPKAKKPEQPVHTHPLNESDVACDLCASHGNPLEKNDQDFEIVTQTVPVKESTVAQRLVAMLEDLDPESDAEEDDAISELGCDVEAYEEED